MMTPEEHGSLPPAVVEALEARGFDALTAVQHAVLAPDSSGRDLRVSSQTGSGKTVALGLVLARELALEQAEGRGTAALVLTPTRELANQVCEELTWLLGPMGWRLTSVTGGTAFGPEARALRSGPKLVVGTPGRMRDHLERGTLDASQVKSVVLDEADQMLDFGFREDLEAILGAAPEERRTHLVSATFSRAVMQLAERYQREHLRVEGTTLGEANQQIDHVLHVVPHTHRLDALVNVLLTDPTQRTLVFARTRADTADVAAHLQEAGFAAAHMSGDLAQPERTRRLSLFRSGAVPILVATDVAARGIDVPDISRVVHLHLESEPEAYTHRSGRTGRAGKQGESLIITTPREERMVERLMGHLGIEAVRRSVPDAGAIKRAASQRIADDIDGVNDVNDELRSLAGQLLEKHSPEELVARLLARGSHDGPTEPRDIPEVRRRDPAHPRKPRADRQPLGPVEVLQVDWGAHQGADARRLVAMVCRRTGLSSAQIGAIQVGPRSSWFEVAKDEAKRAVERLSQTDPNDRRVRVRITGTPLQRRPRRPAPRPRQARGN